MWIVPGADRQEVGDVPKARWKALVNASCGGVAGFSGRFQDGDRCRLEPERGPLQQDATAKARGRLAGRCRDEAVEQRARDVELGREIRAAQLVVVQVLG